MPCSSRAQGDIFAKLGKAKVFPMLNLRSGYHHIALDDDAIMKTAFVMPLGKYKYLKVPFGLAQTPAHFQNLMNKVLNGLHFTLAYLDDVIFFSKLAEQHLKHIQIALTRLKQAKLQLKKNKCLQKRSPLSGTLADHKRDKVTVRKGKSYFQDKTAQEPEGCKKISGNGWLLQEIYK